jgi:chemotaxis family two-component system sensor kinase Cph1
MEKLAAEATNENPSLVLSDERAKDLLRVLDESSIVAFTDAAGVITYVNEKFCTISKYSREELMGKNHRIINSKHHGSEFWLNFWQTISSGGVWKGEIKNRAKDGTFYWLFTTVIPLLSPSGKPRKYISIRYEITEMKKLELDHYQSQIEIEKFKIGQETGERFVSMLAHDLRTPLTAASLSVSMILRQIDLSEKVHSYAKKAVDGLARVENMISHLLDANKIRAGEKIPVNHVECDLGIEIRGTLEVLKIIYGDRFILNVKGDLSGHWDQVGLRRIAENLCSNAIKYGSAKRPVYVDLKGEDSEVSLTVCNEGAVLSESDQKNIFSYMHRLTSAEAGDRQGWGIGLTKVREVAELNGGTVKVQSSKETGTRFVVCLPRRQMTEAH